MAKHKNLQPWLDYFHVLHTYEEKGFLQMEAEKHECYVTEPALYTLAGCESAGDIYDTLKTVRAIGDTVRRLRTNAAWQSQQGYGYMTYSFAVHVVKPDEPHDLLYTILVTTSRSWWKLWMKHDHFDVIDYREEPEK